MKTATIVLSLAASALAVVPPAVVPEVSSPAQAPSSAGAPHPVTASPVSSAASVPAVSVSHPVPVPSPLSSGSNPAVSQVPTTASSSLPAASPASPAASPLATVYSKCTVNNTVALTFDDGPYVYAYDVSKALIAAGAKGTFFFNGNNYACIYDADEIKRVQYVYNKGHQVASHTWSHSDLTTLSFDKIHDEMWKVEQALERIVGVAPAFMRPPYGNYNDLVRQVSYSRNQSLALWDFDSGDSLGEAPADSEADYVALIKKHPATILALNHEPIETTAHQVLPYVLDKLNAAGYKMVTLAECLGKQPYQWTTTPGTPDSTWHC